MTTSSSTKQQKQTSTRNSQSLHSNADNSNAYSLSQSELQQNIKNAFALLRDPVVIQNEIYILIDDVFTTVSTLNAYAAVLQGAGVHRLRVATLSHG